jgi:hypothetical protein
MSVDKLMALTPAFTEKLMALQLSTANTSTVVFRYGYWQTKLLIRALFAKQYKISLRHTTFSGGKLCVFLIPVQIENYGHYSNKHQHATTPIPAITLLELLAH